MMTWAKYFWSMNGSWVAEAQLMSLAWRHAANSADEALLSNLHCNMLDPLGVCMALDGAGLQPPLIRLVSTGLVV